MKFICLGYFDETQWNTLSAPEQEQFIETCIAYDDELRRGKHYIGGARPGNECGHAKNEGRLGEYNG